MNNIYKNQDNVFGIALLIEFHLKVYKISNHISIFKNKLLNWKNNLKEMLS